MRKITTVAPDSMEFIWVCRVPKCQAVHQYRADKCQRCESALNRVKNPNFRPRAAGSQGTDSIEAVRKIIRGES